MEINFILAQILGFLALIPSVLAMQMNKKDKIIFMFILVNFLGGLNFLLLQGYSGAMICFFAIIQIIINKRFEKNGKPVPKVILCFYTVVVILLGLVTYKSFIDVLPIIASCLGILIFTQEKESNIRKLSLLNLMLWITYDFITMAYTAIITDGITALSTVIGIYRYDIKKKEK